MEQLATYKFFDQQGRRMAIFAREYNSSSLLIVAIPCSRKDAFSKKKAKEILKTEINPSVIPTSTGHEKRDFMLWVRKNYQKPIFVREMIEKQIVFKGKKAITLSQRKMNPKLRGYA